MILIAGGTTEGRAAVRAIEQAGKPYYYSTKSDRQLVECPNGTRLTGGLNAEEMIAFCRAKGIKLIIDAAHPFASLLHKNISIASERLGIPVIRLERTYPEHDNRFVWCDDFDDAIQKLKAHSIKKLLAFTGVNTIASLRLYWETHTCWFRILNCKESLQMAERQGFPKERLLFFDEKATEGEILAHYLPDAILTKESGYSGSFEEKTQIALDMNISVFVVKRPALPDNFITVYGEAGLRMKTERLLPGFFALRTGFTTGVYATAAAKAAVIALITQENLKECIVSLPAPEQLKGEPVAITIVSTEIDDNKVCCATVKDAGDDPDVTNKTIIKAEAFWVDGRQGRVQSRDCFVPRKDEIHTDRHCERSTAISPESDGSAVKDIVLISGDLANDGNVRVILRGGEGVGRVTLPGLGITIGEPAINATPRQMIRKEIEDVLSCYPTQNKTLVITISVSGGEDIAKRTFNPKLGIEGGISIIGTSGIVRPFSNDAFIATIQKEIEIAKAMGCRTIVINSGAKSERILKKQHPTLPAQAFIHYGNFIGETLTFASENKIPEVIMGIMIGKAVKLAEGVLDTHSKKGTMSKSFIKSVALSAGCNQHDVQRIDNLNMARELWRIFPEKEQQRFLKALINKCHEQCSKIYTKGKLTILLINEEGYIFV